MSSPSSPEALHALRAYAKGFDPGTRGRGRAVFDAKRVATPSEDENAVIATVEDRGAHTASLIWKAQEWLSDCTCDVQFECKHAYAVALAWLAAHESSPARPIAPAVKNVSNPPNTDRKLTFRERWTPVIEEKLGRPLWAEEKTLLGALSAIFNEMCNHYGAVSLSSLQRNNLVPPGSRQPGDIFNCYAGWWARNDPPADPWALWQYFAYDFERHGEPIPEVFRPMTDTTGIADRIESRVLEEQASQWLRQLPAPETVVEAPPPAKRGITAVRLRLDPAGWKLEMQNAPNKPWKAPTQAFLGDIVSGNLAAYAHLSTAERRLLELIALGVRTDYYFRQGRGAVTSAIAQLALAQPDVLPAVCAPDGQAWPESIEDARWEAVVNPEDPRDLRFILTSAAGVRLATHTFVKTDKGPRWLIADGQVFKGPPPLPATSMPVALLRHSGIQERLLRLGVALPTTVQVSTKRVKLRARLELDLVEDRASGSPAHLVARLVAHSDDPLCALFWSNHGWQWEAGRHPPPRRPEDALLEFDRTAADAVGARFVDFRLGWDHWIEAWCRPVTKTFPEDFLAWRETLPANAEIIGTPVLSGLLGNPLRGQLQLHAAALPEGEGRDWFDLHLSVQVEDTTLTAHEIALLSKSKGKWVHLPDRGWQRLELSASDEARATLDRLGLRPEEILDTGAGERHRIHALQLADSAAALLDEQQAAALRERARELTAGKVDVPASLRADLRPYQTDGYAFLAFLSANGFGGILADDMGLGKTVQTLAWMIHLLENRKDGAPAAGHILVVCPKSVTHGWLAEAAKFAPSITTTSFTPALTDRPVADIKAGVLVANYAQLRLHAPWFASVVWLAAVLDEGQFIKNPTSQIATTARSLRAQHRVVLTGTPVENRTRDLWSLFAFAQPGLLGTQASFARQYPAGDPAALGRLRRRTRHFLLRRTKGQVAPDLPPRMEDEVVVEMEGAQAGLYAAELKYARQQLLKIATPRQLDRARFNILASLLRLRQICCHPALVDAAHKDLPSAKLEALMERLEELRDEGHQVLVFSQFVEMLELIKARLVTAKIGHLMLTGKTENRAELVTTFQQDPSKTVFLLSLKAAGFGLNLTAASYAILYDPWWNPAVEAQAIDRTHRIGQTQPVTAYRLLAQGTVEEKIRALQKEKAALASAVVQEESLASVLDLESLRQILA